MERLIYIKNPQRWDGANPAGEDFYQRMLEDIEQVMIDVGDHEKVERLIYKLVNES